MKTALLSLAMLLAILPLSIADNPHIGYYPALTGSPAVQMPTVQSRYFLNEVPTPIREGLPVIVYGQLPYEEGFEEFVPAEAMLHIDEYGVLVNYRNEPAILGTTGRSFAHGFDWTTLYSWNRIGPYFSTNLRGFKASLAQTNKYKNDGARTYGVFMFNGFYPAKQVIKQWYRPRQEQAGYMVPGVTKMVIEDPRYVQPGIPGQPLPEESEERIQPQSQREGATVKILPQPEGGITEEDVEDLIIEE